METDQLKTFNDVKVEDVIRDLSLMGVPEVDYLPALREVLSNKDTDEDDITHIWMVRQVLFIIDDKAKG